MFQALQENYHLRLMPVITCFKGGSQVNIFSDWGKGKEFICSSSAKIITKENFDWCENNYRRRNREHNENGDYQTNLTTFFFH